MNSEIRNCQNCKKDFVIEPDDFAFYEKIKVPAPTWCPECRAKRRFLFRSSRSFYRRDCDLCHEKLLSVFQKNTPFPVYCQKCWWSDKWNPFDYAKDYDFSKTFFEQFLELLNQVPKINLFTDSPRIINGNYLNLAGPAKNSYFSVSVDNVEDCYYCFSAVHSKDLIDCAMVSHVESAYECFNCQDSFRVIGSMDCRNCVDIYFSKDLVGCSSCFGCAGLRNKKYYIFNKPYSKEEYFTKLKDIDLGSCAQYQKFLTEAQRVWKSVPVKYFHGYKNIDVTGDYIYESKNAKNSFWAIGGEDCRYMYDAYMPFVRDAYDYGDWGYNVSLAYECVNCGENMQNARFCYGSWNGSDWQYCDVVFAGHHLFGCVSLRNKDFCILNKQYTKEEYEKLVPKIIAHMNEMPYRDKSGRTYKYGEFFPLELSPFAYNESSAFDYFPLTEESAIALGCKWHDSDDKNYVITQSIENLPDCIQDVGDTITKEIIACAHAGQCNNHKCTGAFKIIEPELQFYKKMNLPLPRLCPNCRHYERLKQRNPMKLWHRKCMKSGCTNEFETSYAPDRPEIVYCEQCYNQEVA